MQKFRIALCCWLIVLCVQGLAQTQTSNFSTNDEGWTVFDQNSGSTVAPTYTAAGGNPGGFVQFSSGTLNYNIYFSAPAKFKGNFSFSYNQALTFDMKVNVNGTDNSQPDIILRDAANAFLLVYQLPTKPVSASWTTYSIPLNESSWHLGSIAGAAPTRDQFKQVLANIGTFLIRMKYQTPSVAAIIGQLDNVVLNSVTLQNPPRVTSFSPASGVPGTTVTITGNNFNSAPAQNKVFFGAVAASVTSATASQLVVTLPPGATYAPVTVVNLGTGLQGSSTLSFNPLFNNNNDNGGRIMPASFTRGYQTILQSGTESTNSFGIMDKGDFDGDGKIDLITTETGAAKIFVYRNLGASGPVSTASFAAAQTLPALTSVPGGSPSLAELIVADIDSDGKPDVAASVSGASSGYYAVYRNTSTPGTISFANPLFFGYPYYSALLMTGGDLDGDGRIDLMGVTGTAPSNIYYCQNLSTPGNIDFGYGLIFSFSGIGSYSDIITADLNGDGKPEIIAPHYNGFPIQVFENNSTPGNIVMKAPFDYSPGTSLFDARITAGDLDGDGKIDLAWSAYISGFVFIGQNIFNGTTFDATSLSPEIKITNTLSSPQYLALGDVNADGRTDIVMSGYSDMGICENRSTVGSLNTNSFLPTVPLQGSQTGQAIAAKGTVIADLDGDNKPELAMGYTNGSVLTTDKGIFIFHNESFPAPVISNTAPSTGTLATAVAVNGTLLNNGSSSAQPTVRMGAIKATLSGAASNAVVNTSVPSGTMTGKFTLARNGLVASSAYPFTSKFNTNRVINATSFGPPIAFALGSSTRDQLQVADFDDDGKADVWVVDASATAKIFRNTATTGQPITAASLTLNGTTYGSSTASLIVDVDGDGLNDVIGGQGLLQNASTSGNISLLSGPNGTPSSISGFNTAVAGDFNFDGKMDVITASGSSTFSVWENQSTRGNFVYYANFSSYVSTSLNSTAAGIISGMVAEDFDKDGYTDLITLNSSANSISVYLNNKKYGPIVFNTFQFLGNYSVSGLQPSGITSQDFDGDGDMDIAISYANSTKVSIYSNQSATGDISFGIPVDVTCAGNGYGIGSQDLDGDGLAEVVVIHRVGSAGSFTVFQNTTSGGIMSFVNAVNVPLTTPNRNPQAIAFADINQDLRPDILIVADPTASNALLVYENKIALLSVNVTTQPTPQTVCAGVNATFTTAATAPGAITYQWQFKPASGTFSNIANGSDYAGATTASLTVTTTNAAVAGQYQCVITSGAANATTTPVTLTINATPPAPTGTGATACSGTAAVISASGASNGQYRWYTVPTGGTAITGEVNATYTTPTLTATTIYYAAINNGTCEGTRTAITATINTCTSTPVISPAPIGLQAGGSANLNLVPLITTPGSTLNLTSLQVVAQPASGAKATISNTGVLSVDYSGISFIGSETVSIKACDQNNVCTTGVFTIDVSGEMVIYNALSPNGANPSFIITNISLLPETKNNTVYIFDRWQNEVWRGTNYDNTTVVFKGVSTSGTDLPTGTYFYRIDFASGKSSQTGFISLKR
jgi:hypothetical protein